MDDLSILIKIGGQLEKSFHDAIRAAQGGLSDLNAAVSKEMAEVGRMSTTASREMAEAGRMYTGTSKEMAAAGRMGASAFQGMTAQGQRAVLSSENIASAGKGASSTLREMATEGKKAADAIKGIALTGKVTPASVREISSAMKNVTSAFKQMSAQSKRASGDLLAGGREITSLSTELAVGEKGALRLSSGMATAGEMAGAASKGFLIAGAAIAATAASAAIAGKVMMEVGKYSVQVGMDFESAMSDAAATANASTEDFAKMEQAAMEMGKTTSKTASESANALEYMALAGWDVDTSISALPSVLKMSEASGMDLGQTSDLVTDSMAALGVTVEQLPGYLDVATRAQTKSNQSAQQLMEAYIGVGGTMKNLNVPIEESATALGVLANRGLKGSEGGTALNAVMVNLTTGAGQAGKMMQELGVSAFDQRGRFIGLEATLQKLDTALQGYSEEQRNAALAAIGGKQHMDALNALMAGLNTTNREGISEWAALTRELKNCSGSLQAMRDMKLDNLKGDMETLKSATQDAGIKIYKHLNTPLRDFAQFGTQAVYQVSDALESDGFAGASMAAGGAIADGMGVVVERLPEFLAKAAVSVGSFLVGFAADLPASLLSGIIKGAPRLLRALPGLGVDIVKAVIKGILSLGSAPLKALKSLFFGGWDDVGPGKADINAARDYPAGIGEEMRTAADLPASLQGYRARSADIAGDVLPFRQEGMLPAGLADSMVGQGIDIPDIDAGTARIAGAADMVPQVPVGIPMDMARPTDGIDAMMAEIPTATDTTPALWETKNSGIGIHRGVDTRRQVGGDTPAAVPTGILAAFGEEMAGQVSTRTKEVDVKSLMPDMDTADMDRDITVPFIDMAQDIVQTPTWTMADTPAEVTQIPTWTMTDTPAEVTQIPTWTMADTPAKAAQIFSATVPDIPAGVTQTFPEIMLDMSTEAERIFPGVMPDTAIDALQIPPNVIPDVVTEATQVSVGTIPDMAVDATQIPVRGTQMLSDIVSDVGQMGDVPEVTAVSDIPTDVPAVTATESISSRTIPEISTQDITLSALEDIRVGDVRIPPVDIDIASISDGIAQAKDTVRTSLADNLAGQTVRIAGTDVDDTGLSGKMRSAGTRGGQAFVDGIGKSIGGIIDVSKMRIDTDLAAPMPQIPLQGVVQTVSVGAMHDAVLDRMATQDTVESTGNISGASPRMGHLPAMTAAQDPAGSTETISGWARRIADMFRAVSRMPDWDILSRRSVVEETLDALLEKKMEQNRPISDASPSFTLNLTVNIKGSGDTKEDVAEAARIGAREFERCMDDWIRKYRRTGFRTGFEGIFG